MGSPIICGFTGLPIDIGDDVAFMLIKKGRRQSDPMYPFDLYAPATPLMFGIYNDDEFLILDKDQEAMLTGHALDLGIEVKGCVLVACRSSNYAFWVVRRDVYDGLIPAMTYHDSVSGYTPISDKEVRDRIDKELEQAMLLGSLLDEMDDHTLRISVFLATHVGIAEGQRSEAVENILKRIDALPRKAKEEEFRAVLEPFFDIYRVWAAMISSGRVLYPSPMYGRLTSGRNHKLIADFMKMISAQHEEKAAEYGYV